MLKDTFFHTKRTLNVDGKLIDLSSPKVMGILNVTPDSFYSGSRFQSDKEILSQAEKMIADGADFIDLGAYSSRVGAEDISCNEELARLLPSIKLLRTHFKEAIISIDTFRAEVAERAIAAGAHIINDISGGELDVNMFETVAKLKVPYILMHMKGTPQTMANLNQYDEMVLDICQYFSKKVNELKSLGVHDVILDPGFGFAKNIDQNFSLLKQLQSFSFLELPLLVGLSRKSMIWRTLGIEPGEALNGTSVLHTLALQNGAAILRVHDVKEAKQCIKLLEIYHSS
jgi:dihydropteroate synthase